VQGRDGFVPGRPASDSWKKNGTKAMVRSVTRNVICFLAAFLLLALAMCAVEVVLRTAKLRSRLNARAPLNQLEELIAPDETSWINVKPLIDVNLVAGSSRSIHIQTDEHGLRGPSTVLPKPRGTYRILCLGGDNVFGSGLEIRETLPDRLQRILNLHSGLPVEVINAGCPNAGPLINLLRYRTRLSALQPDLVILCLNEEDLGYDRDVRGALHLDEARNPAYASHPGVRGQGSSVLDGVCDEFLVADWLLGWAGNVAGMRSRTASHSKAPVREGIQRDLAAIVPLSQLISGQFGHLLISISPSPWGVDRAKNAIDKTQSSFARDVGTFLENVHLSAQIEIHDGLTSFSQAEKAHHYFSPQTGALSAEGNHLYAQQLAAYLLETIPGLSGTPASSQQTTPDSIPLRR